MQRKSFAWVLRAAFALAPLAAYGQSSGTFGTVIPMATTPSDIVLDESRHSLYLVNNAANAVQIYDYNAKAFTGTVAVGTGPLGAAMSMDNHYLYVANHDSTSLSVIDLTASTLSAGTVTLPAKPQGVEVGADGRAVIATDGTGTTSTSNTLLIYDPNQQVGAQVLSVAIPPAPATPPTLPTNVVRITTTFNGRVQRTPDGKYIIGVSNITNNTATMAYIYEVASGTILRNRTVTGQSTTLAISPDASGFMAGFALYDMTSLNVVAQQSNANANFTLASFNTTGNYGGSVFSPDGTTLYSAFSTAATTTPASAPSATTLLISDPRNLGIKLGINLPESIISKLVITSDGANIWGLSSSGLTYLPISTLYNYPILMPQSTTVFLANDDCNPGIAQGTLQINNIGGGKLTFSIPSSITQALVATTSSGVAPAAITLTMEPGRSNITVVRTPGTNLFTGTATNQGTPITFTLASAEAINVLPVIRVYMNYRDSTQRGVVYPVPTVPTQTQGLYDIQFDAARNKVYVANAGYNRIEVFDTIQKQFVAPIPVGQLPHQMAMSTDGSTLYVAATGGETVQVVDLDRQQVTGIITFPSIPRNGTVTPVSVAGIANSASGLQLVSSAGLLYEVSNNTAVPRTPTSVTGIASSGAQTALTSPVSLLGSDDGTTGILFAGNGTAYLYDGINDAYTTSRQLITGTVVGYYGPVGVAPGGNFLLADGLVLNKALTVIGGAASPGQITVTPPAGPGGIGGVGVTSTGLRNVAAVTPVDQNYFLRMSTPVRNNLTTAITDDVHTILEAIDTRTGATTTAAEMPDNPYVSQFGTARSNIPARQMAVDPSTGTVYAITLAGLSVIPMTPATAATLPTINATKGVLASDGTTTFKPGSFFTVTGTNLAQSAAASTTPPPTVLGGSCVLVSGVAVPLLVTSSGSIQGQIPTTMRPGAATVQVRSLNMAQRSTAQAITITKP